MSDSKKPVAVAENRSILPYPTEIGGQKFELVDVTKEKDLMLNTARMHAQQEYDRIMEQVEVLHRQAEALKRRLEITELVHKSVYQFHIYPGKIYWLVEDTKLNKHRLAVLSPGDWTSGPPEGWRYLYAVKNLGDNTWIEINQEEI